MNETIQNAIEHLRNWMIIEKDEWNDIQHKAYREVIAELSNYGQKTETFEGKVIKFINRVEIHNQGERNIFTGVGNVRTRLSDGSRKLEVFIKQCNHMHKPAWSDVTTYVRCDKPLDHPGWHLFEESDARCEWSSAGTNHKVQE